MMDYHINKLLGYYSLYLSVNIPITILWRKRPILLFLKTSFVSVILLLVLSLSTFHFYYLYKLESYCKQAPYFHFFEMVKLLPCRWYFPSSLEGFSRKFGFRFHFIALKIPNITPIWLWGAHFLIISKRPITVFKFLMI